MNDPLHMLKHEHRVIEQALRALEGICLKLTWGEQVPAGDLKRIIEFLREFAETQHHGKEETHFFPALEGILDEAAAMDVLVREHQVESQLVGELTKAVDEYDAAQGDRASSVVDVARRYIDLLTAHMQKEENILFKIADDILDDATKDSLGEAFRKHAEAGRRTSEEYERIADELETTWSII